MALKTELYKGRGEVLARRIINDQPQGGYLNLGNCVQAQMRQQIDIIEHRENQTGNDAVDDVLDGNKTCSFTLNLESYSKQNLELLQYGAASDLAAVTITNEIVPVTGPRTTNSLSRFPATFSGLSIPGTTRFHSNKGDARTLVMSLTAGLDFLQSAAPHLLREGYRLRVTPEILGRSTWFIGGISPTMILLSETIDAAPTSLAAAPPGDYNVEIIPEYEINAKHGLIEFYQNFSVIANIPYRLASYSARASFESRGLSDSNVYLELLIAGMNKVGKQQSLRIMVPRAKLIPGTDVEIISPQQSNNYASYQIQMNALYSSTIDAYYKSLSDLGL